jgi:transcriptional regulator with XRE-family HTH domain
VSALWFECEGGAAKGGYSQETLANMAAVARYYMSDVERGAHNPTLQVIERIATALDTSPGSLLN